MSATDFDPPVQALDRQLARRLPHRRAECAALVNALLVLLEATERSAAEELLRQALGTLLCEGGEDDSSVARQVEQVLATRQPLANHLRGRDPNFPANASVSFGPQMGRKVAALRFELGLSAARIHSLLDTLYQIHFPHDDFRYELAQLRSSADPSSASKAPRRRR